MKKVTIITSALFAGIGLSMSHLATAAPSQTQTDLSSLDATTHELMGDNGLDRFRDFMQGTVTDSSDS
ncbi:MAG: hypothetical protein CVV07_12455 [Gammaproteobacteria bacterium HGW-Gammaproteobacteria-11]|nr:MAG: hypothetical protein CVV07_12455 [Gammaproteobacteria bacterium HGW-Gammaproteobacteria-11]